MFRTAALLIVVTLVGSPIGKAVCDVWCLTGGGDMTHMKHGAGHDAHEGSGPSVKARGDACDIVFAGLFVPERVQRPTGSVSAAAVTPAPLLVAHPMPRTTVPRGDPGHPHNGTLRPLRI